MNIAEILKDAPKGTKLYSPIFGEVILNYVNEELIKVLTKNNIPWSFTSEGKLFSTCSIIKDAECLLFPSKTQRDWNKFKIEPQFPTTIDESRKLLDLNVGNKDWYKEYKIGVLRKLLIARDAWWKVDNDWEPDCNYNTQDKHYITYYEGRIYCGSCYSFNRILVFRTADIRDKFLDTFKYLIEQCKEFL